jgi:hypothetical protein
MCLSVFCVCLRVTLFLSGCKRAIETRRARKIQPEEERKDSTTVDSPCSTVFTLRVTVRQEQVVDAVVRTPISVRPEVRSKLLRSTSNTSKTKCSSGVFSEKETSYLSNSQLADDYNVIHN